MRSVISSFVIVVSGLGVQGQSTTAPRTSRGDTVQREQQRQVEMQMIERALTTEGRSARPKRYPPAVLDQIRADFLQIQVTDRKLAKAINPELDLDLKLVGQLTGDIRKCSRRLKENLALPQPQALQSNTSTTTAEDNHERLRSSLSVLSGLIESFVSNPMFEQSKVFDRYLADKAWQDLTAIIKLSGGIKRSSERLRK